MENFRQPKVPPESEQSEWGKESAEKPVITEENIDEVTAKKIEELKAVTEMVAFLNGRLDESDERVLRDRSLEEFLEILNREKEDASRAGNLVSAGEYIKMIRAFNDRPDLSDNLFLDIVLNILSVRLKDLKKELKQKLGHEL